MTRMSEPETPPKPLSPPEAELDGRLETLLNEGVSSRMATLPLPADFTARVMAARPFAPWEVRKSRAWRVPAAVGGGLVLASAGLVLSPLLSLGPETAAVAWAHVLLAASLRPLSSGVAALPLLAEAAEKVCSGIPPGFLWVAVGGGLVAGASLAHALVPGLRRRAVPEGAWRGRP